MSRNIPEEIKKYMHNRKYWVHWISKYDVIVVYTRTNPRQLVHRAFLNTERRNANDKRRKNRNGR